MKSKPEEFGWCHLHEESVSEGTYRWKGCWGCHHFGEGKSYHYFSVYEASSELGVSQSTVRRWIKNGKLEGELFIQGRHACMRISDQGKKFLEDFKLSDRIEKFIKEHSIAKE